jgi:DtxR family transcriptional regulator, Mn-dependent transcriptional regulator
LQKDRGMYAEDRPSPTVEDYLGVIYTLARDGERVIGARLAESLDVSAPTVTATLRRMERDGWIAIGSDKAIALTDQGQNMAKSVIRRHMLTEWMLARVLKLPFSELHREAHQIEHTLSPEVEDRLQTEMDDPQLCPHGNPLPGFEDAVKLWLPLSQVNDGECVVLQRIHENLEDQYEQLTFLEAKGIKPGVLISVIEVQDFNETMRISVENEPVILGISVADLLYVEKVPDRQPSQD